MTLSLRKSSAGFLLTAAAVLVGVSPNLSAQEFFLMGFDSGSPNAGRIFTVSSLDGSAALFHNTGFSGINALAIDKTAPQQGLIYFSPTVNNNLFLYDFLSGSQQLVTNLGVNTVSAAWYDARYYFMDAGTPNLNVYDPVSNSVSVVAILRNPADSGDVTLGGGDIAFRGDNMFITGNAPAGNRWGRYDITTLLNASGTGVAAADLINMTDEHIADGSPFSPVPGQYTRSFQGITTNSGGEICAYSGGVSGVTTQGLYEVDVQGRIDTVISTDPFFASAGDLSDLVVIPEPSSVLSLMFGSALLLLKRRRQA